LQVADCRLKKNWIPAFAGMTREREMRLFVGATLCGRPKTTIGKWQLIIKISSTQRGEDKGEGDNYIADCWLLIAD